MEKIQLKDFLDYTAVSTPACAPDGSAFTWVTHRLELEKDGYVNRLHIFADGEEREIEGALPGEPLWVDEDSFLCAQSGYRGHGAAIAKYTVSTGILEPAFELPIPGRLLAALPNGQYLVMATVNVLDQRRVAGLEGAALDAEWAAIEEETDMCWVLDEFPFWRNGQGLINKQRTGLYLYTSTGTKRITDELFNVDQAVFCPETGEVYYTGAAYTLEKNYLAGLYSWNPETEETCCIVEPGQYEIGELALAGKKLVFTACIQDDTRSLAQMHDLYVMELPGGEMTLLHSGELSFGCAMSTDASLGSGCGFTARADGVYFLVSVEERVELMRCSWQGELESLICPAGSVDAFALRGDQILFAGMLDMRLPEMYLRQADGTIRPLTAYNKAYCDSHSIIRPERLRFVNAEGNEIHGLVLVPPQADTAEKSCPAILSIHGGPRATYGEVFSHEMQYWAGRGYYVLFCNPTGSLGRGQYFGDVCGKTGQVDYDDLMQFVDEALEKYPAIDPARLGVTGGSYGGFMTNWIIGHTRRFAAAVSQCSTSNNISNEATTDNGPLFVKSCLAVGQTRSDELLWDQSPLKYIDNATTPTLFIHSLEDYCTYHVEALQMFRGLQRLGVDTRVCLFRHEHHSLSRRGRPRARIRRLREIMSWMDRYLGVTGEV